MVRWFTRGFGILALGLALGCEGKVAATSPARGPDAREAVVEGAPPAKVAVVKDEPVARPAALPKDARAEGPDAPVAKKSESGWETAVDPKPLSQNVKRGLAWLVGQQHDNGGWAQGEESKNMGRSMDRAKGKPSVADTCMAVLALMRSGSTPKKGPYAANIRNGLDFVCKEIGAADEKSLYITSIRGTRVQSKLGTFIDTFLSSMLLAEAKDRMPDEQGNRKIFAALDKVMDKIEKNQRPDGTFGGRGWANSLSLSMASKGYNRAGQVGYAINGKVRERLEMDGQAQFSVGGGGFKSGRSAGVDLYAGAASLSQMRDSDNTNLQKRVEFEAKLAEPTTPADEKAQIKKTLARYDRNEEVMAAAEAAIVKKLDDKRFIAGFGSNGGEEFLSYMNIGESLVVKGGDTWEKWDGQITKNLNRIQNKDGSWTGHHCITGRTFCTSAALLVLMTDRAPVPVAAKIRRR